MYEWRKMTPQERRAVLGYRKERGYPWHSPPHVDFGKNIYHLSAACFEHKPVIGVSPERLAQFEGELLALLDEVATGVYAWCVLPNHYHALVELARLKQTVAAVGQLHGRSSHYWNGEENLRGRKVWYNCTNRAIRSERHFWATMNYIHYNPVRHGYVEEQEHWPFSSAQQFLDSVGREEAQRLWDAYPLLDYGKGWDDPEL